MTERRPGQWPVEHPVHVEPGPAPVAVSRPELPARVEVPVPDVRLVVTVDLTGRYDTGNEVSRDLYEQTRYSTDCHTAIVRLGEDALRVAPGLGAAIASRFFLAARAVEIHVPAGTRWAYVAAEAQEYMRRYAADHAQMIATSATTRTPG
ncbi:hypothetical protein ACH49_22420 [Streptomyces leeuwenhoekii]|uniref:Uncharacterized protein n=1 Tax=Streptomyces leeuwenhoekii TaxID=1437453 RepID=A0ABR5HU97_STRLW|nr:hypothetical protein [Streptomyces leeuwenhoekii]KMS74527.1 hypothetical protein ACH49_22420 [Streptomyces leeuwenhoekii]